MRSIFIGLLLLFSLIANSQNNFTACGNQSGSWDYDTVFVSCDVLIPNGQQLLIEGNTRVLFEGHYRIKVAGNVKAMGTAEMPIVFTIADTAGFSDYHTTAGGWDGFHFEYTSTENDSSIFEYCQFYYGKAAGDSINGYGGAMLVDNFSKIRFENCEFHHNYAFYRGGAVYGNKSHFLINNCLFINNFAGNDGMDYGYGGAVAFRASLPDITETAFENNASTGIGGGASFEFSDPHLLNCEFRSNYSGLGGAIGFMRSEPMRQIANVLIYENASMFFGGGIACIEASPKMTNLTIVNNSSAMGGGYYCNEKANPVLANSIIWNNVAADSLGSQVWVWDVFSKPEFHYCNIQGAVEWFGGSEFIGVYENNLNENPYLFDGWKIDINSVCTNAGTPDTTGFNIPVIDFFGLPRIVHGRIDMGVMEVLSVGLVSSSEVDNQIKVFPNPLLPGSVVSIELQEAAALNITIFDLNGNVLWKQRYPGLTAGKHQLPLKDFLQSQSVKNRTLMLKIEFNSRKTSQVIKMQY
ncbi:MAG: right-handed parallel beta-helix repeat-containing protein [Bacteroidales bacterium]|jgi:hypothetical protein|nr:right-handed parallel beta-helix repeat-containing protein [Bacteroidales bacterium]